MEVIKRLVNRLYPELKAGYHNPMLGRIERITKTPADGGQCTMDEPLYAVDIQPLDEHFKDKGNLFRDVVLGMAYAGNERGFFALPDPGCIVEFCFAYASPKLVFIRGVIPWGIKLPPVDTDEAKWHKNRQIWQGYDKNDNWQRHTTADIEESCVNWQRHSSADIQESCEKVRQCTAKAKQLLKAPKTWVGSDQENLLQIVVDCLSELESAISIIASHTHNGGQVGISDQAGDITESVNNLTAIRSGRLEPITE